MMLWSVAGRDIATTWQYRHWIPACAGMTSKWNGAESSMHKKSRLSAAFFHALTKSPAPIPAAAPA
ncbi:hypothetical protein, partial [Dyella sp.]|uniref:hypothetical protein n=1 Tax=Dyella sp. TaxID=1869338 RepID=UPI0032166221